MTAPRLRLECALCGRVLAEGDAAARTLVLCLKCARIQWERAAKGLEPTGE